MTRRYEREILELLERKDREHRGRERSSGCGAISIRPATGGYKQRNVAAGRRASLDVASIVLALLAFVFHTTIHGGDKCLDPRCGRAFLRTGLSASCVHLRTDDPMWRGEHMGTLPFPPKRRGRSILAHPPVVRHGRRDRDR